MNVDIRVHVIVLNVIKTITHLISARTSFVNFSGLILLIICPHLLQLLSPPIVVLL